ncbi:MAG: TSUP family transporter [Propionibacteriaceae bacterium]|nr:TSUP family transporter [Propionibacteriaceae bacterium]
MIDGLPMLTVVLLCLAALVAGWIDSVVGGGGLIQLPALLVGLPTTPVATVSGTNKLSSVAGTAMASGVYLRKVRISWPTTLVMVAAAFGGSSLGAYLIQYFSRAVFFPIMIVVVAIVGLYTWRNPQLGQVTHLKHDGAAHWLLAVALGAVVGMWDGLIGPGTGVFFVIGLVGLLGYEFLTATTMAKLANLATNIAALIVLGTSGHVLWAIGGCMAVCNLAGGAIGSRMAIRHGNSFIRNVFLVAIVIIEITLFYETFDL